MNDIIELLSIYTNLTDGVDLFAYDIPLGKSGLWINDSQTNSRFNGVDYQEFNVYYRDKNKSNALANLSYLKNAIDSFHGLDGQCLTLDDQVFRIDILYTWDFLDKDSEGYYVWANKLRLFK